MAERQRKQKRGDDEITLTLRRCEIEQAAFCVEQFDKKLRGPLRASLAAKLAAAERKEADNG